VSTILGITHSFEDNFVSLSLNYLKAVSQFGVTALVIPYTENVDDILSITDGVILSGGGDLSECVLLEKPDPRARNIYPKRDIFEAELCRKAFDRNVPVLGICRGIQIMNVALGGKINQHIAGHTAEYSVNSDNNVPVVHKVLIDKESFLFQITKSECIEVNSFHHQCVSKVSPNLSVCAESEDSVIEAIECKKRKFFLGVQWHPEKMMDYFSKNIFESFVNACKK